MAQLEAGRRLFTAQPESREGDTSPGEVLYFDTASYVFFEDKEAKVAVDGKIYVVSPNPFQMKVELQNGRWSGLYLINTMEEPVYERQTQKIP